MFPYVPLEITVRNKVPARIFSLGTSFLTVILWRNYFIARISTRNLFSSNLFSKKLIPNVPLEVTVRN
jgi:hypothetical protein